MTGLESVNLMVYLPTEGAFIGDILVIAISLFTTLTGKLLTLIPSIIRPNCTDVATTFLKLAMQIIVESS